jgi:prophage regulatory protein
MRLLGIEDLRDKGITISRQTIHALMRKGVFPRPVRGIVGGNRNVWVEEDIDTYIAARIVARIPKSVAKRNQTNRRAALVEKKATRG